MQREITKPGQLLSSLGVLSQVGWARQPLVDCNLDSARVYRIKYFQRFRIKRWDYYAIFTPKTFFSATVADLGYAGNIFVYIMNFETGDLHEEGLVIPLGKGVILPRNSTEGDSSFMNGKASLYFEVLQDERRLSISWPRFHNGRGIAAEIALTCPPHYDFMNIVIPIGDKRFYYNRKVNCLPAKGTIQYGDFVETLVPETSLGSLDWGRGVWEYKSYWNWASASGFLPDGRTIGLNLGCGFGDLSKAGENAVILDNHIHKLESVTFDYVSGDYMKPWKFIDSENRLNLVFAPFRDRVARTNLGVIKSEVHQLFGKYNGSVAVDTGEVVQIKDLIGFAEEHHAKW